MKTAAWYGYVYPKNVDVMQQPKILVPDIADKPSFAYDEFGEFAFASGYGITFNSEMQESPKYILGLLNSKTLNFFNGKISTIMRGGFFRYFTQYLKQFPIRAIDFSNPTDKAKHDKMVSLVERMLTLHKQKADAQTTQEKEVAGRQIAQTDAQIDKLVYELYGLTAEEIALVEAG